MRIYLPSVFFEFLSEGTNMLVTHENEYGIMTSLVTPFSDGVSHLFIAGTGVRIAN
jgi:hypothetical protein